MSDDPDIKVTIEEVGPQERSARHFAPLMIAKGAVGLIAGIVLLFWPTAGLAVAAVALGAFLVVDGIERLVSILRHRGSSDRSDAWSVAGALLRLVLGAAVLFNPSATGQFWASFLFIIAGLNLVGASLLLFWKEPSLKDDLPATGTAILMLLLGLFMILLPLISALVLLRILGALLVLASVPSIAVGLRSR
jgi:uncharacterized membrane protein HdeD (DUF308 family)